MYQRLCQSLSKSSWLTPERDYCKSSELMTNTEAVHELARQLVDMQTQLAFQEDTISHLNQALALQQRDIEKLQQESQLLRHQYREMQQHQPNTEVEPAPPHY